ncbi:MAG TPA: hypothetical protein PKA41_11875, partial [Verrucomicrobiota bacterium]|nr:hypothetical protein [Verrucomicrobiota bacterium]
VNAHNALTIAPDNILEITVTSPLGTTVPAAANITIFVRVTDLTNIVNATVTGSTSLQPTINFLNNGVSPDETAGDAVYSANVQVPAAGSSFTLSLQITAPGKAPANKNVDFVITQPPPNDSFANAVAFDSAGGTFNTSNRGATRENSEPSHCGISGGKSVWWRWTAPKNQITTVSTLGSGFDSVLAVYTGNSVASLSAVECNDDISFGNYTSEVIFQAVAGVTYRIAVDGYFGYEGDIILTLSETPPVTNDNFASRTPVTGINRIIRSSNFGTTVENIEPYHFGTGGGAPVWWAWTSPTNGPVYITTAGSTYDTVLAVYTGSAYGSLSPVACNDDRIFPPVLISEVTFNAVAGTTYQIAVDGYGDGFVAEQGNLTLSILTAPPNDGFANRAPLNGAFAVTAGYNVGASHQSGEPNHCFAGSQQSVWWTWTAPHSGNASVSTFGSSYDTVLAVYTGDSVDGLTDIACNDDENYPFVTTSKLTFAAVGGTTYHFAVDGYLYMDEFFNPIGTEAGLISLTLSLDGKSQLSQAIRRDDGYPQFTLTGDAGRKYSIEASGNAQTWSQVGEVFLIGNAATFVDTTYTGQSNRFYRALPAPLTQ